MDKMNKIGQTALIYACIEKHVDMAKLLLKVTLDNKSEENNLKILNLGFFQNPPIDQTSYQDFCNKKED